MKNAFICLLRLVVISLLVLPIAPVFANYSIDFEFGVGPEWSSSTTDNAEAANFTTFLGQFGRRNTLDESVVLSLPAIIGTDYVLEFDLYMIGSWDGSAGQGGPDQFTVDIDGLLKIDDTFANATTSPGPDFYQSFREPDIPPVGRTDLGYNPTHDDAIYRDIQISFTATKSEMDITFQGLGLQEFPDESWGGGQC